MASFAALSVAQSEKMLQTAIREVSGMPADVRAFSRSIGKRAARA
ncbi:hypothetical protein QF001_004583 [Paraburkholderia youngii]